MSIRPLPLALLFAGLLSFAPVRAEVPADCAEAPGDMMQVGACSRFIEQSPDQADLIDALLKRGQAYGRLNQLDLALEDFGKVIELDPSKPEGWLGRGFALYHQDRYQDAIEAFRGYGKLKPLDPPSRNTIGKSYYMLGDYEKALVEFNAALELNDDNYNARINRALTYSAMFDYEKALHDVTKAALVLPPDDRRVVSVQKLRAELLEKLQARAALKEGGGAPAETPKP